jgi:hypothetical protein
MAKKSELNIMTEKYNKLLNENEVLKKTISELNENTIIESMNDMKIRYQELMNSTVSLEKYNTIQSMFKKAVKVINGIEIINDLSIQKIIGFNNYIQETNPGEFYKKISDQISAHINFCSIIDSTIAKYEQEYLDNYCDCDCEEY